MNKKIKIIDLVNRIESEEEIPEKIKYNEMEFKYDKLSGKYTRKNSSIITWFCIERFTKDFLNKTVEILEDNTEEIILTEKIFVPMELNLTDYDKNLINNCFESQNALINQLVRAVNKLRKEENER